MSFHPLHSNEQAWLAKYWDIGDIPFDGPTILPPPEWGRDQQHLLMGPIRNIYAYVKSFGMDYKFELPRLSCNQILYLDDQTEICMMQHFFHSGQAQANEKQTLHLLPGWQTLCEDENPFIDSNMAQVVDHLQALCVSSHLEAGVEIDIVTGSPAILDIARVPHVNHLDMLKDVWEVTSNVHLENNGTVTGHKLHSLKDG